MVKWLTVAGVAVIGFWAAGCGVSDRFLDDAQKRIDFLTARGVPDSLLGEAKVYLYQLREFKRASAQDRDIPNAVKHLDIALNRADNFYLTRIAPLHGSIPFTGSAGEPSRRE
jgi:hypothetical protein